MKLLWALFRWLVSHLVLFLSIAALVVAGAVLSDWWNERKQQELHLSALQDQLTALGRELTELRRDLSLEKRYLQLHQNEPSRWTAPVDWYQWRKEMDLVGALMDKKNARLKQLRSQKERLAGEVEHASAALYRTQQKFVSVTKKSTNTILLLSALVFFGPVCWRAFWYFIVAGSAQRASKIQLDASTPVEESIHVKSGRKNCAVSLNPGERLFARMSWVHQYTPGAEKRTRFLHDWKYPFISYAAGLAELTRISAKETEAEVVLSSGQSPDAYLCEIQMQNHPGIVVYPSQLIAITDGIRLKTRWCLTNLHAWIAGRWRHIILYGTGRIYLEGSGGIDPVSLTGPPVRISESIVAAYDARLSFSTVRTETFWPYYRGIVPLFDYEFEGKGVILRQAAPSPGPKESATIRFLDGLLSGIGKLLGL